jgi:hypothetical protein
MSRFQINSNELKNKYIQKKINEESEIAFKMLQERAEKKKREEEEDTLKAEIIFLQEKSIVLMAKQKLPSDTLRNISKDGLIRMRSEIYGDTSLHKCSSYECRFLNMKKGTKFMDNISKTISESTGLVYVCISSGSAHICGEYCNKMKYMSQGEGFSCIISGRCSNNKITVHKLGGSSEDKCHFVNQEDNFNIGSDIIQTHNNDMDIFEYDESVDKNHYKVDNSLQDAKLIHNMVKNRMDNNNNTKKRKRKSKEIEFRKKEGDEYGFFSRMIEKPKKKKKKKK